MTLVFFLLLFGGPAALAAPSPDAQPAYEPSQKVAVMPFFVGSRRPSLDETADTTLSCPIGILCAETTDIEPGAGQALTRMAYDNLRVMFGDRIVPLERSKDAYAEAVADGGSQTPRLLARKVGRTLGVGYVLVGTLWRWRGRGQVPGDPESPASAAFALYLVKVDSGAGVWRGIFDQTQQPLTENLLKARQTLKMGVKWLSVRELARFGVGQVLKSFPTEDDLEKPVPLR